PVIFKPNAGLPSVVGGKTVYDVSPEEFARDIFALIEKGVRIAGGCCGTTPEYIKALKKLCGGFSPVPVQKKEICAVSSYTHAVDFGASPVLIGERLNPTGKKLMKEALNTGNMDYILGEAIGQSDHGAHVLDVNVGLPGIDEAAVLKKTVEEIQAVCDLPLQIDTSDTDAMERALRIYNGKPLINSVNGKEESMEKVFPLAKKYGGVLIALTLDEAGIPQSAEGRLAIAEKIVERAKEFGIEKKDIIFDPLCMAVSADANAATVTLRSLKLIEEKIGCRTSLGVSNVSFGLPDRDTVNCAFFSAALEAGLSAAIMNPYSDGMMRTYHAYRVLHGLDENCADYIAFSENASRKESVSAASDCTLQTAVEKGMKELAGEIAAKMLEKCDPMSIINGEVIPALDRVGRGFEEKKVYLPQLLMSAEAAKAAFEKVKGAVSKSAAEKFPVVLATVKGDIHDIGKNIVRLLLENYGYRVTDLGRDVPPEAVLEAAERTGAPVVGLSALMTTTVPAMEETVKLLHSSLPSVKIVVGGAVLTEEYAKAIGADKYAADAMETVRYCDSIN
ncbi:MAG: dihydropteroate synthase, partial [Clostridia bacterium]|nr:dihydropteroate synthase [Clostridia bacterium]